MNFSRLVLGGKVALPIVLLGTVSMLSVSRSKHNHVYAASNDANRFIAQAERLRNGLGVSDRMVVTDTFRFEPAKPHHVWWMIEGRLPNGSALHSVWDEATGELCFMSWMRAPSSAGCE